MYYEQPEDPSKQAQFGNYAEGPFTQGQDFIDPNQPFEERSEHVPGGILATYKKRLNLTPKDVMEQEYWDNIKELDTQTA